MGSRTRADLADRADTAAGRRRPARPPGRCARPASGHAAADRVPRSTDRAAGSTDARLGARDRGHGARGVRGAVRRPVAVADRVFSTRGHPDGGGCGPDHERAAGRRTGSGIRWESLGRQGRNFVAGGPSVGRASATSRDVRAGTGTGLRGDGPEADVEQRAQLAVDDLERAGGFDRTHLLVATTTGTGWLDPGTMAQLRVPRPAGTPRSSSMQYSYLPSWLSYLVDQPRAREAGRELFDAVYERWVTRPDEERPRLSCSVRAWARSAPRRPSAASSTCATAPTARCSSARRASTSCTASSPTAGTTAARGAPVFRGGRTVRFSDDRACLHPAGTRLGTAPGCCTSRTPPTRSSGGTRGSCCVARTGSTSRAGADVLDEVVWVPFVTFWQVTRGHAVRRRGARWPRSPLLDRIGRRLGGHPAAPDGWTAERADRVRELVHRSPTRSVRQAVHVDHGQAEQVETRQDGRELGTVADAAEEHRTRSGVGDPELGEARRARSGTAPRRAGTRSGRSGIASSLRSRRGRSRRRHAAARRSRLTRTGWVSAGRGSRAATGTTEYPRADTAGRPAHASCRVLVQSSVRDTTRYTSRGVGPGEPPWVEGRGGRKGGGAVDAGARGLERRPLGPGAVHRADAVWSNASSGSRAPVTLVCGPGGRREDRPSAAGWRHAARGRRGRRLSRRSMRGTTMRRGCGRASSRRSAGPSVSMLARVSTTWWLRRQRCRRASSTACSRRWRRSGRSCGSSSTTSTSCAARSRSRPSSQLVHRAPPGLHLVLSSRRDPELGLARLRLEGRLLELRATDLAFTVEEVAAASRRGVCSCRPRPSAPSTSGPRGGSPGSASRSSRSRAPVRRAT